MKPQYSKILPLLTGLIFVAVLIKGFTMDFSTVIDTAFYVTATTVSGGIFGTCIVNYLRKSQLENVQKIKENVYEIATNERLKFIREYLKLKQEYNLTDMEMQEIDGLSPMDEFEADALSSLVNNSEEIVNEASEKIDIQNY